MKKIRIHRLSRGGKIVKNFLLAALFAILAWGFADFRINDPYLSFRRAERANWVGPAQIQGVFQAKYNDIWAVGTYGDQVLFHLRDNEDFEFWQRRSDGPELIPTPDSRILSGEAWIVAVDVPEGTAAAELSMNITCHYWQMNHSLYMSAIPQKRCPDYFDRTYVVQGELLEDGGVLFHVTPQEEEGTQAHELERALISKSYEWLSYQRKKEINAINCNMQAVFYDTAGREIGRAELNTLA